MPLKQEISHLYYGEKLSASQVAKSIGRSKSFVLARLREMDGTRTKHEGTILRSSPEYSEKLRIAQTGESNNQVKLTESDVLAIRNAYDNAIEIGQKKYETELTLSKEFNVGRSTISDIVKRRTWKHI